jgi:hypothetical protein
MMNPFDTLLYSVFLKGSELYLWFLFGNIYFVSIKDKWKSYGCVLNNIFTGNKKQEEIITVFSNIQRTIHGIYRFKHLWRIYRAKWYNADDLFMNPISPKDKGAIVLFENNTKYIFQLRELIKMVHSSLSNCCHFFPEPIQCKNPYTNLPFHKSNLYNIYFAIRRSYYKMPTLFETFFRVNFDIDTFLTKNEELINHEYLKTYVENNCVDNILHHVLEMFRQHKIQIKIHADFPKDNLYNIMKPYLSLYFESNYSINYNKKARSYRLLNRKLHKFHLFNKCFGRRKMKFISEQPFSKKNTCVFVFEDKHPPFYEKEDDRFMTSHLNIPFIQWSHSDTLIDYSGHDNNNQEQSIIYDNDEDEEQESDEDESHDGDSSISIHHIYVNNEDDMDSLD